MEPQVTQKQKIIIYSTDTCHFCHLVKDYLTEKGFLFEDRNVGADMNFRKESVEKSGQLGVPVIDIDGKIIIGFDKPVIDNTLGITINNNLI